MADSVDEALQEAINEIKAGEWVIDVEYLPDLGCKQDETKPCNYIAKLLSIIHQTENGENKFSRKIVYINTVDYTYKWDSEGLQFKTPIKDFLESKLDEIKTNMGLDYLELLSVDEINENAMLEAIKGTTGHNADKYIVKAWRTGPTTYEYKIIEKTTVE